MTNPFNSLRTRLLLSHLAVVAAGVVTVLIAANWLAPTFVDSHVREMENMAGSMMGHQMISDFRDGVLSGLGQAVLLAAVVSGVVAVAVAVVSSRRLLRPLDAVRAATRRLAAGSYSERVPEPRESELAALATDVNALASALQQTERRRLRLISEVSHELRTPLATIKGYAEGLVDGVFPADEEVLTAVGREAARLERLAADLNELSRSEEGQIDLRLEPGDLATLAGEVAERLRPQFQDQGVDLVVEAVPPLPAEFDRDRMTQVFTNIIGNALTYTSPGGRVTIRGELTDREVRVAVIDTGRGVAPEQLSTVFERFYRVDRSAPGGTGIGLTIARDIARRHGGDLTASSPGLGAGATFTVAIPRSRPGQVS